MRDVFLDYDFFSHFIIHCQNKGNMNVMGLFVHPKKRYFYISYNIQLSMKCK